MQLEAHREDERDFLRLCCEAISPKRYLPQNSILFGMGSSAEMSFLLLLILFQIQKPLAANFRKHPFFLYSLLFGFPLCILA